MKLKEIEDKIEKFSLIQKIQLFTLPVLITCAMYFIFIKKWSNETSIKSKIIINTFKAKPSIILKDLATYCKKYKITIHYLNNEENFILLNISNKSIKKILALIYFIENYNNYTNITQITLNKNSKVWANMKITFDKKYQKKSNINIKKSFFVFKKNKSVHLEKNHGVIFNYKLVNNHWEKQ